MRTEEIQIRDPFVVPVPEEGLYYLYGSTDPNVFDGPGVGFDVYRGTDLSEWEGPFTAFRPPAGFWSDRNFWAPEMHRVQGRCYLFASFKAEGVCRGTQILMAESPLGPFVPHSERPLTPPDWECLDGTLYIDGEGRPYMVFCHEWVQVGDGRICAVPLTADLTRPAGEPQPLFCASEAPWVRPYPRSDTWVTDGPFLHRTATGALLMLWSSFGDGGYAIGVARSRSGEIQGPWEQESAPLFARDGGHGMVFRTFDGQLMLTIHTPNETPYERAIFLPLCEVDDRLLLAEDA